MRLQDACGVLSISPSASLADAQKAYRKLALLYHPDRSSADDATAKFQTIGEAWERVQKYHDDPRRWGSHADPEERSAAPEPQPARGTHGSFDEMYKRWFGEGYEYYQAPPPRKHAANCSCAACESERRREEIFEQRAKEREVRRRDAQRAMEAAQNRAREESMKTARVQAEESQRRQQKASEAAVRAAERRAKASASLERAMALSMEVPAPLEELLDAFSGLKEAVEKCERAAILESGTAAERALLERASRRLDVLAEAAVEAEGASKGVADDDDDDDEEGSSEGDEDEEAALMEAAAAASRRGGTRKQRQAAAKSAAIRATQDLAAARTASELTAAIHAASALPAGARLSTLEAAIESANERLVRLAADEARAVAGAPWAAGAPAAEVPVVVSSRTDLKGRRKSRRAFQFD